MGKDGWHMQSKIGLNLVFPNRQKKKTESFMLFVCLCMTVLGLYYAFYTAFNFPCNFPVVVCGLILFCTLIYFILQIKGKNKIIIKILLVLMFFAICLIYWDYIFDGINQLFGFFSETVAEKGKISWDYPTFETYDRVKITVALLLSGVVIAFVLSYAVVESVNVFLWLLVVVLALEPMMFFGILPNLWSFILLLTAGAMCWCTHGSTSPIRKNDKDTRNIRSAGTAGMLIALCVGFLSMIILLLVSENGYSAFIENIPARSNAQSAIKEKLTAVYIEQTPPQGGITGGEFSKTDEFSFTGETALVAEADKFNGCVYLRSFTGGEYTADGWKPITQDEDMSTEITLLDMKELSELFHGKEHDIKIKTDKAAEEGYDYVPYRLTKRDGNKFSCLDIANYDNNLFLLSKDDIYSRLINSVGFSNGKVSANEIDECFKKEAEISKSVKEKYLFVPKSAQKIYDEFSPKAKEFKNIENIIKYVMGSLSARANYTLSPGATPSNEDFATYFLYENKKGYCTHFATASTLIFRSMGIPARYLEGYVITNDDYTRAKTNEDGKYLLNIRDTASHAWCEVYLDGFGWVPVEVTPGLTSTVTGDMASADGEAIEYETDSETEMNEVSVNTPQIKPENVQKPSDFNEHNGERVANDNVVLKFIALILIVALFALLIWAIRYNSVRKWNKRLYSDNKREAVLSWFNLLERVMGDFNDLSLITWAQEQENKGIFEKQTLTAIVPIIEKAAYSKAEITENNFNFVRKTLSQCIKNIYNSRKRLGKIQWLFIKRLPLPKEKKKNAQ